MISKKLIGRLLAVGSLGAAVLAVACAPAASNPTATTAPSKPAATAAPAAKAETKSTFPSKPVLLVVAGQPGGGADVQARAMAAAIERSKVINQDIAVLNKGGGGSQEPFTFTASKKGDPHYLMATAPMFITYTLTGQAAYKMEEFTPAFNLVWDPSVVVVPADSKYKTFKDLIDAAKASPGTIKFGGGVIGTQDHMSLLRLEQAAGVDFNFVSYGGGGDLHRAALSGEVEAANGNPSDFMASIEAKKLRALAIYSPERSTVPALKDIPTAKEQGVDLVWEIFRGWCAPAGVSQEDLAGINNMAKKVVEDPEFKKNYLDKFGMRAGYLNVADFQKRITDDATLFKKLLTDAGVLKN